MLRIVLPLVALASPAVDILVVVLVEIILVVDVDIAVVPIAVTPIAPVAATGAPSRCTYRNSRAQAKADPGTYPG